MGNRPRPSESQGDASRKAEDIVEVAAGLVFRSGKLLITQRYAAAHQGGLWEFPGGKREPNESFSECLTRELIEELGIEVEVGKIVESILHQYPDKKVLLKFFRCHWKLNEPQALGCPDFRWVNREQLIDYQFLAADARILEKLRSNNDWWQ